MASLFKPYNSDTPHPQLVQIALDCDGISLDRPTLEAMSTDELRNLIDEKHVGVTMGYNEWASAFSKRSMDKLISEINEKLDQGKLDSPISLDSFRPGLDSNQENNSPPPESVFDQLNRIKDFDLKPIASSSPYSQGTSDSAMLASTPKRKW